MLKWPPARDVVASLVAQRTNLARLHGDPRIGKWSSIVPTILYDGEVAGSPFIAESAMPGVTAERLFRDPALRPRLLQAASATIAELHARTLDRTLVDEAMLHAWIDRPLRAIHELLLAGSTRVDPRRYFDAMARELRDALSGREALTGWSHGDYWLGNVLTVPDGSRVTGIVDWDLAGPDRLATLDPIHLVLMARRSASGLEFGWVVRSLLADPSLELVERSALAAAGFGPKIDPGDLRRMVLLAWLHHVAMLATTEMEGANPRWVRGNIEDVVLAIQVPARRRR